MRQTTPHHHETFEESLVAKQRKLLDPAVLFTREVREVKAKNLRPIIPAGTIPRQSSTATLPSPTSPTIPILGSPRPSLYALSRAGSTKLLKKFFSSAPYELSKPDAEGGKTPLMYACMENRASTVRWLLSSGARFSSVDGLGRTALHVYLSLLRIY